MLPGAWDVGGPTSSSKNLLNPIRRSLNRSGTLSVFEYPFHLPDTGVPVRAPVLSGERVLQPDSHFRSRPLYAA